MDPGTAILAAQAIQAAIQGGTAAMGASAKRKQKKKDTRRFKRQTYADLLSQALGLDLDNQAMSQQSQDQYAGQRAANLADTGAGFRRALL